MILNFGCTLEPPKNFKKIPMPDRISGGESQGVVLGKAPLVFTMCGLSVFSLSSMEKVGWLHEHNALWNRPHRAVPKLYFISNHIRERGTFLLVTVVHLSIQIFVPCSKLGTRGRTREQYAHTSHLQETHTLVVTEYGSDAPREAGHASPRGTWESEEGWGDAGGSFTT